MIHYSFNSNGIRNGFVVGGAEAPAPAAGESIVSRSEPLAEDAIKYTGTHIQFGEMVDGEFVQNEAKTPIDLGA